MLGHFCVIDFETTGCSPETDRVVEIAAVRIDSDYREIERWDSLVHPQCHVGATHVHGITNDMVGDAPRFEDLLVPLTRLLDGAVLVAHNFPFDRGFLVAECLRMGVFFADPPRPRRAPADGPSLPARRSTRRMVSLDPRVQAARTVRPDDSPTRELTYVDERPQARREAHRVVLRDSDLNAVRGVCTVQLARRTGPAGSRSLEACCKLFGVRRAHAHAALDDALATAELLRKLRAEGVEPEETASLPFLERVPLLALTAAGTPRFTRRDAAAAKM